MIKTFFINMVLLVMVSVLTTGCSNRATATPYPEAKVSKLETLHVEKLAADKNGVNDLIVTKLTKMGYKVSTGATVPGDVDVIVTYVDKWQWDMSMYMIELTITIRELGTNVQLAQGNSYHTSLTRKSPEEMVDEVIDNIFKEQEVKKEIK